MFLYAQDMPGTVDQVHMKGNRTCQDDTDFTTWAGKAAQLLPKRRFEAVDLDTLIEEVEGWGMSQRRNNRSYLWRMIEHVLNRTYTPAEPAVV